METRFLETFLLVARHGSLAEAARYIGVTPAAVNQRVQALEAEVGTPLLARVGRTVQPTEAGRAILDSCERVLAEVRHLRGLATTKVLRGELRLGTVSTATTSLVPAALHWLKERAPDLDVFLLPGTSPQLFQQLTEERIDAAVLVRPPFHLSKGLEWRTLRHEKLRLLCPADMRFKDPLAVIRSQPFIRYDRNNWGGRLIEPWLRQNGLRPREWLELDSLDAIAVMVSSGLGVAVVPEWGRPWPEGLHVRLHALPGDPPTREIGALWLRSSPRAQLVCALLSALQTSAETSTVSG